MARSLLLMSFIWLANAQAANLCFKEIPVQEAMKKFNVTGLAEVVGTVQSRFFGPLNLDVWRHTQASWNVTNKMAAPEFELIRYFDEDGRPTVLFRYRTATDGLRASLSGSLVESTTPWQFTSRSFARHDIVGKRSKFDARWVEFELKGDRDFLDVGGEHQGNHLVTQLNVKVYDDSSMPFDYGFAPMFLRGPNWALYDIEIPGHNAHAGDGRVSVAGLFRRNSGRNEWNGTPLNLQDNYYESNTARDNALIGLHRHQNNQEAWRITAGRFLMANGVARRPSLDQFQSQRPWDNATDLRDTDTFVAEGGYMELREVGVGDETIIVPNGDEHTVFFHGLAGISRDGRFETIGTQN